MDKQFLDKPKWLMSLDTNDEDDTLYKDRQETFRILGEIYTTQFLRDSQTSLTKLLEALSHHLESRFQREEFLQRKLGYPEHETHMAQHMGILVSLRQLQEKLRAGLCSFGDIFRFIKLQVIEGHLNQEDINFRTWLDSRK